MKILLGLLGLLAVLAVAIAALTLVQKILLRWVLPQLAGGINNLRRLSGLPPEYRPVAAIPAELRDDYEAMNVEFAAQGCVLLGDYTETVGGQTIGITRWFADASRTACGWFGVARPGDGPPTRVLLCFSETGSGNYAVTGRGGSDRMLAKPPNMYREFAEWDEGLARTLDRHRAQVARALTPGEPAAHRVETLEGAQALMGRMRLSGQRWRQSQRADVLLEADVRSVLQERFDDLGEPLIEHMQRQR